VAVLAVAPEAEQVAARVVVPAVALAEVPVAEQVVALAVVQAVVQVRPLPHWSLARLPAW